MKEQKNKNIPLQKGCYFGRALYLLYRNENCIQFGKCGVHFLDIGQIHTYAYAAPLRLMHFHY